jgi:hypothetical protein
VREFLNAAYWQVLFCMGPECDRTRICLDLAVQRLKLDDWKTEVRFWTGVEFLLVLQSFHSAFGVQPTFCLTGYAVSFPGSKMVGA